ncbi:MAG: hypothetical protein WCJ63_05805 [Actinomycetes bacterium]
MTIVGIDIRAVLPVVAAVAVVALMGCGSSTEQVSGQTSTAIRSSVLQLQTIASGGCKISGGDAGLVVDKATKTLVGAAARHPGSTVDGVPIGKLIHQAAPAARKCGFTDQARQISLAALAASTSSN